ncbi:berberine bridge enzyme-like 18 [Salvia splendens]|uniref:berberine bridge enzyme-like 18 n=1 Tax=Salvia splendens TaxID=180675 RepID=UPI001C25B755|nr:berberine bridge enzyme-like 18 [Salvia splendens]
MAPPRTITLVLLIFANISSLVICSSPDHGYDDFLECLIDQFERSNSATDIIYTPRNATYASLLLAHNLRPASAAPERPGLIVTPLHVSEIQAAVSCSRKLGIQIRVRSGGHDYEGLSYTSAGAPFVAVDMRNFRSVTIDAEAKTAWVQVGATLGQLYYTLSRESDTLAFPAGVCPTVGIGGHFSGGGYGMISRRHALAADNIVDARLVNAAGEVLDRSTMGEDLFWAIRGGGGTSFGIVVEFKVKLVTVPEIVTVFNVTRTLEENATELIGKWQEIADKVDENLLLRLFLNPDISPATGKNTVAASFTSLYLGKAEELLPIMQKEFPELGLRKHDCIEMRWIETFLYMSGLQNQTLETLIDRTPQGFFLRSYYKGKSDFVSDPIPASGLNEMWKLLEGEDGVQLELSPYGGALSTFSESETPFPHRRGTRFMIHYAVLWADPDESGSRIDWIRRLYNVMEPYVMRNPRAAYFNYRDLDIGRNNEGNTSYEQARVWGMSYFKGNFRRLVRVKTKFDPSNFFRNEQSIPPLVSE